MSGINYAIGLAPVRCTEGQVVLFDGLGDVWIRWWDLLEIPERSCESHPVRKKLASTFHGYTIPAPRLGPGHIVDATGAPVSGIGLSVATAASSLSARPIGSGVSAGTICSALLYREPPDTVIQSDANDG